ncbi:FadR/GntR family transcriptional regulator, partial [Rhizobium ruizarguesonis]
RVVETGIARLAAERRDPEGLDIMRKGLAGMLASVQEPSGFTAADILFHLGIAVTTGNYMIRVNMESMSSVQREVSELFSRRANRSDADWR